MEFDDLAIMIVEDNANMRTILRTILSAIGVKKLHEYTDGTEALKELKSSFADILIVDWKMEPLSGYQLVQQLRSSEGHPKRMMPIIMVTAHTTREHVEEARDVGVDEYIVKPISPKNLLDRLIETINHPRPFVHTDDFFGPDRRRKIVHVANDQRTQEANYIERPTLEKAS